MDDHQIHSTINLPLDVRLGGEGRGGMDTFLPITTLPKRNDWLINPLTLEIHKVLGSKGSSIIIQCRGSEDVLVSLSEARETLLVCAHSST